MLVEMLNLFIIIYYYIHLIVFLCTYNVLCTPYLPFYFSIICLISKRARVTLLLTHTQCIDTINVLHMLLSVLMLLQIKLSHYSLRFYLQMTLQYLIYKLTIAISNGKKKSVY